MISSAIALYFLFDFPIARIGALMKGVTWTSIASWEVASVPLFIWMGEILFRTDISARLFKGIAPFVDKIPGKLLHTNLLGCTLFAAVSGSSVATTATVGKITTTELFKRGYNRDLAAGSLAGAGSLGMMIPPSLLMIVYGLLAEVSIASLFMAGVLPGLMIAALFMGYVAMITTLRPGMVPSETDSFTRADRLRAFWDLAPIGSLIIMVLGGIYSGFVTPSEAAAAGVVGALLISAGTKQLTFKIFLDSMLGTITMSCMVMSLLFAAAFMSSTMAFMHIPQSLAAAISGIELSPYLLILMIGVFLIVLGILLEGLSIVVMTTPITLPLIVQAGFDPVWYGVFLVVASEMATISPPVGFNLFVIDSLSKLGIYRISRAAIPFFLLMCVAATLLTVFPQIALWLPSLVYR